MCACVTPCVPCCCRPGSFLVRPSERNESDLAIVFKTETEVRNWKVSMAEGKYSVKPYPQLFTSLKDVMSVSEGASKSSSLRGNFYSPLCCRASAAWFCSNELDRWKLLCTASAVM